MNELKMFAKKLFAKRKISRYESNLWSRFWWRFVPGTIVIVKWPVGDITVDETMDSWDWTIGARLQKFASADPNDHYRPWLECNVGKQGWDWDWKIGPIAAINDDGSTIGVDKLLIKFRKSKLIHALAFKLKYY